VRAASNRFVRRAAAAAAACAASLAIAQGPAHPATSEALAPYDDFHPHALLAWHPEKRAMLVRARLHGTQQVHLVEQPGAPPRPLTDLADPVSYASWPPSARGDAFVFTRGSGGNDVDRLYRQEVATGELSAVSPAGERVLSVAVSRDGKRLAYAAQRVGGDAPVTTVHIVERVANGAGRLRAPDRVLARLAGHGWDDFHFSGDARRLVFVEHRSASDRRLWLMDAATGRHWRVTRVDARHPVAYGNPRFSADGRALFATSDRDSEFKRLVRIALPGGAERALTPKLAHDVESFEVSFDAGRIAFVDEEDGADVLRFLDLATLAELPRPPLVPGVIRDLAWRPHSREIGFDVASARTAGDVFSYDLDTNRLTRWTNGNSPALNTAAFPEPEAIRWKSFDGREIHGLYYRPPARFTGKRPVLVSIPGGAGSQARAGFIGRNNYLLNELGIAIVRPNVRGSPGYGKTFARLGEGGKRPDAVKDIGALLDWIAKQPGLDASRVAVIGVAAGGDLALACAEECGGRIAAARPVSADFPSAETVESLRRALLP
jgi:dipeptidyl aminopeptidase/acylaminoacyl peptidase